jgi:DNA-binding transcriptional regulator YiaG
MQLSKEVRKIRERLEYWGIKNQWLAEKLDVNKSTLSQYLNGSKEMPEKHKKEALRLVPEVKGGE